MKLPMQIALGTIPSIQQKLNEARSREQTQFSVGNVPKQVIHKPFIDFHTQRQLYEDWMEQHNARVKEVRQQNKGKQLPPEYQLIKSNQLMFIYELTRLIIRQLSEDNLTWASEGGMKLNPNVPYVLWTNNRELADQLGYRAEKTVWNHIERLKDLGFIVEKKNHGTRSNYELHINPEFLVFFDEDNPEKVPATHLNGIRKEWPIPKRLQEKVQPPQNYKRTLNKKLINRGADERAVIDSPSLPAPTSSSAAYSIDIGKNTPSEARTLDEKLEALCPHPALKTCGPFTKYQSKGAPRHPHEEEIRPLVRQFLWTAHRKLWSERNIYDREYHKVFEYIVERYFVKCKTMEDVQFRFKIMEEVVEMQRKFVEEDSDRFTMYPMQFFELDRQLSPDDFSGFQGVWTLYCAKVKKARASEKQKRKWRNQKMFKKAMKEFSQRPTKANYIVTAKKVQKLWPEHMSHFQEIYQRLIRMNQLIHEDEERQVHQLEETSSRQDGRLPRPSID